MSTLSERAMLTSLHRGRWSATATDHEVSEETNERYNAGSDAGSYGKRLVAGKFLKHVTSKIDAAVRTHNVLTLPWSDNGDRILSCVGHSVYAEQMRLARLSVTAAAKEFATEVYPKQAIPEAKTRLGKMFNQEDYPSSEEVVKKFYIDVELKPVMGAGDFRAELSDASLKAITKDIEKRFNERIEGAVNNCFERIVEVTEKMVTKLREYQPAGADGISKNRFQDSLVFNIKELAELLPSLNITEDKRLDELQKRLLEDLTSTSPAVLRVDDKLRDKTSAKAEAILKKARSFLA